MIKTPVYLDNNATTPLLPSVAEAINDAGKRLFGNPSSSHYYGQLAKQSIELARTNLATLIGAQVSEIYFTGCATEANNLAILGTAQNTQGNKNHLIVSAVEHPAVMQPALYLREKGWKVTVLAVDQYGQINPDDLKDAISDNTALVSIMHANNEIGTIQPIEQIASIVSKHSALLHVDAAQSIGKIPVNVTALSADLLTIAGHKFYAPKGIGALYIRHGVRLNQLMFGANHESGLRPGTENVMHIVGIGVAAKESIDTKKISQQLTFLRDKLHKQLVNAIPNLILNGHHEHRLPNTLNVSFPGISGKKLLHDAANDIAASVGSACHSDSKQVSGVLAAMGIGFEQANAAIRLSVGRLTTKEEIEYAASSLISYYNNRIPDSAHN